MARSRLALGRAAHQLGFRTTRADKLLDHEIRKHIAGSAPRPKIAVLAIPGRNHTDALTPRTRRTAQVERWDATLSPAQLHLGLAASGRFDLIVVDTPVRRWPRLLAQLVFHLRPGGLLVFRGVPGQRVRPLLRTLRALDRARSGQEDLTVSDRKTRDVRPLASAASGWYVTGPHVVVVAGVSALAKLRHEEVDAMLAQPGLPRGRVVAQVPGVRFTARCQVTQNASTTRHTEPREIEAPTVSLREYHDVMCLPGQVIVQDSVILPDTYRNVHRPRSRHRVLVDLAARFAALPEELAEPVHLRGTFVHLDSEYQGHYGHLLTEQLSRLWAWPHLKEEAPLARVLMCTRTPRTALFPHERDLLATFGVDEEDVVLFDRPVRVERLLSAAPMFSQPGFVHPAIAETWRQVGDALANQAPPREYPRRIFCARRTEKRRCRNAAEVEALFVERGFSIVHAEDHTLAEQAAMFRNADVIAGYAGAAMFNLCYTDTAKDVLMLVSESYTAQNEYLMAAVQGHRLTLVWCPSDIPQPQTGFSADAYQSSFVFDVEKDQSWLEARLEELGCSTYDGIRGGLGA